MASPNKPLPLRENTAAATPPPDSLPHGAVAPTTTETIVEKKPSSERASRFSDPPSGRHKPRSGSAQFSGAPLSSSCHAHRPQSPPTPLLTPPASGVIQPYYLGHLGSHIPNQYLNQNYPPPEYGYAQPASGSPISQQSRRPSFIQGYHPPVDSYQYGGPTDDGRLYGLNPTGTDHSILPYGPDPNTNFEAIIQTTQSMLSTLHSTVPSLDQLYARYRHITEELDKCKGIVAAREKETEELRARESQVTTTKDALEHTLAIKSRELTKLKGGQKDLESEKKVLLGAITTLESEKSELEKKLEEENATFKEYKAGALKERETEKRTLEEAKSELEKKLKEENAAFEKWKASAFDERKAEKNGLEAEKSALEKKLEEENAAFEKWKASALSDRKIEKIALESEKSELGKKLEEEKAAFEKWKVDARNGREAEKRALIEAHTTEIKRLEETFITEKKATGEENEAKISELRQAHKKELESLEASADAKLKEAEERHGTKIAEINDDHLKHVERLGNDHDSRVETLKTEFSSEKEALENRYSAQAKERVNDFNEQTNKLKANFASEKEDIITRYNREISQLQEIVSSAKEDKVLLEDAQKALEKEKVENSALRREKESFAFKRDEAEAQRANLEAEIGDLQALYNESLVEMKTLSEAMKEMADTYEGSGLDGHNDNY